MGVATVIFRPRRDIDKSRFGSICCLVSLLLLATSGFAATAAISRPYPDSGLVSSADVLSVFNGLPIDTVVIDNRNIFDTDDPAYSGFVFSLANKLHIVTRETVIRRELLLHEGDLFSSELAAETARNLRSRCHLYNAWIEVDSLANGHLAVTVVTVDVWSIVGGLTISTDGGETDATVGFEERNLLGYNQFLQLEYTLRERWNDYMLGVFRDTRLAGKPISLRLELKTDSFDDRRQITIAKPFYNLSQKYAYNFDFIYRRARTEFYEDQQIIAQSKNKGLFVTAGTSLRFGNYRRKIGPEIEYEYRYKNTFDQQLYSAEPVVFSEDSVLHRIRLGFFVENVDYVAARQINGFGYTEDFTTGQSLAVSLRRAFPPGFRTYAYDQLIVDANLGWRKGNNLFLFSTSGAITFRGSSEVRRATDFTLRYYFNRLAWLTVAARSQFVRDWRTDGQARLTLGGKSGLRGFPTEFRTGDRLLLGNVEARFFPRLELLSVLFGGTAFMDVGRAYKPDESISFTDFDVAVGVGLRVSFEKSSRSRILRFDLSRDDTGSWVFSVGSGQYF